MCGPLLHRIGPLKGMGGCLTRLDLCEGKEPYKAFAKLEVGAARVIKADSAMVFIGIITGC